MTEFLNNTYFLIASLFANTSSLMESKPMYNKEFFDELSSDDEIALDEAIRENIKKNTQGSFDVELSGKKVVKIVLK